MAGVAFIWSSEKGLRWAWKAWIRFLAQMAQCPVRSWFQYSSWRRSTLTRITLVGILRIKEGAQIVFILGDFRKFLTKCLVFLLSRRSVSVCKILDLPLVMVDVLINYQTLTLILIFILRFIFDLWKTWLSRNKDAESRFKISLGWCFK